MAGDTNGAGAVIATWVQTLGPAATGFALDKTITPQTLAALATKTVATPQRVAPHGLTLATLPRISLALRADAPARVPSAIAADDGDGPRADLEIVGLLGEGGMGRVHLARQRSLHRDVAIKTLKPEIREAFAAQALLGEAVINGLLEHPNIIPVHALGCDDGGRPVLVMKRVEGVSWRELLYDDAHPKWERVAGAGNGEARPDRLVSHVEILMQVCNALHFAHSRDVVHRDVKPENVMIGDFGEVYLLDWGIAARLPLPDEDRTSLVGTPGYMAPEMVALDRAKLGPRTDVYLLGATLHEVLTRRCRHEGATVQAALLSAYASEPVLYSPSVPIELAALANAATSADPDKRPESALAFRKALADYLRHRASLALSASAQARLAELDDACMRTGAADDARVRQLMTECRFAFAQALREWDGNAQARDGLRATLLSTARYEIARGNADAARALLAEVADAPADVREKLAALEHELAARAQDQGELRKLRHEMDLSVGARQRALFMGALALIGVVISAVVVVTTGGERPQITTGQMLRFGIVSLLAVLVGGVVGRKYLLRNTIGRRTFAVVALCVFAIVVHRFFVILRGGAAAGVLMDDLLIMSAVTAAGALTVTPQIGAATAMFLGGALASLFMPGREIGIFSVATVGALVAGGIALRSIEFPRTPPAS